MKKALAIVAALFTVASAHAQSAQALPPPSGQATGSAPPVASELHGGRRRHHPQEETRVVVDREAMEERLAQLEELLGEAFENSRPGRGRNGNARGKINQARNELEKVRRMLAQAPDVRSYYPQQPVPVPVPVPPPAPAVQPIADGMLQQILRSVSRESFAEDKLRILSEASPHHYFLVSQVRKVTEDFSFSSDRLKAVKLLWPRVLDRENAFQLYDSFQFSSDKKKLKKIISD